MADGNRPPPSDGLVFVGSDKGVFSGVKCAKDNKKWAKKCKFVVGIEYRVLRGDKRSISTVGRDSHRKVSRRPVRAGVSKINANRR
ncbi:MAG: hypothetical protein GWN00_05130 [Aliifodinibius sp.]|nr:hypothetical protein [Fodinibius sp.]NIV10584.1 hypothetical protein [Fodinibius sp.]NIY24212.1 hypothetical protein [Fodinibius sp.]